MRLHDARKDPAKDTQADRRSAGRAEELEKEIERLAERDAVFWSFEHCPADVRESDLEDILAFESVGTGTSLFEGLQEHGINLPAPEKLDEEQCAEKAVEVVQALACLRIFLIGFHDMTPREFYTTLWNQTLWEGCYLEKRNRGAITMIDVSHRMPRSEMLEFLEELQRVDSVH
jgi:hypothetical protein